MISKVSLFIVFGIVFLAFAHEGTGNSKCIHDELKHEPEFLDVEEEPLLTDGRVLASTSYPKMRLYSYFPLLTYGTTTFRNYVRYDLVPPVMAYFSGALRVKQPLKSNLKISLYTKTLCGVTTPRILQTTGVAADHFFFFTAESADDSWAAGSTYCFLSSTSKRPLVSRVKFNAKWLKIPGSDVLLHEQNTYLLMHEIFHSLGLSGSLFKYFIDANGVTLTNHVKKVALSGSYRTVLNIPVLTNKLRKYFGCTTLEGAYLEDDGGDGTANSHLERRHFAYEVMTSGVMHGRRISEFSLTILEASGWYLPNYTFAEPFYFGQGQGCTFLKGSCSSSTFKYDEFCKAATSRGCTPTGRGGGVCQSDTRSDGCKFYYPARDYDCESPNVDEYSRLTALQVFGRGAGSRCFNGNLTTLRTGSQTTFCFRYTCNGSGLSTTLSIQVGRYSYLCRREGNLKISGYNGVINCPDPLTFCQTAGKAYCPRNCFNRGKCVNNKCVCYTGFKGVDCGLRV
jgi:proprotein convertase subtilisin/kexin type 5